MGSYIVKRILLAIPLLIIISFITFVLINLISLGPGGCCVTGTGSSADHG